MLTLRDKLRVAEQRVESIRQEHGMAYEDLRAANEELQTVNHELKMKLEEVSRANNDMENFMAPTDIPMLFLDRDLGIKRYTAPLRQIFNIKSHDHGRPIGDLTHNMEYRDLEQDTARVLHELVPIERQIKLRTGERVVVRIRPYRTAEDKVDGGVVTFVSTVAA